MSAIACVFDGEAFAPRSPMQLRLARDQFGEGEVVMMTAQHERSWTSHNHQFATIADLWENLPERLAQMPYAKTAETLRKHALIESGFCDCETVVVGSNAAAERVAASLSRMATLAHGYCIVVVEGAVVRCYTPQSQSARAMGGKRFQASKTAVLEWIEAKIGERAA